MAYININTGSFDNDSNADKIRIAFNKVKSMFSELFNWKDSIESELDLVRDEYILVPYNPILGEDNEQKNVINSLNTFPFSVSNNTAKTVLYSSALCDMPRYG